MTTDPNTLPAICGDGCVTPVSLPEASSLVPHAKVFKALGDETRLRILERIARSGSPVCACNLEGCCDLSQPTISHHLKVLREAGLITGERRGTWIYYSIRADAVKALPVVLQNLVD